MTAEEGYQEALRRIEYAQRTGATALDLSRLELTRIPNELVSCQSLQTLGLVQNQLRQIENLPHSLRQLNLIGNQIRQIENLPNGLQELNLWKNQISRIENLPAGLQNLHLTDNQIGRIENLPDGLQMLHLWKNQIRQIENLPNGLQGLYLMDNHISWIENLPDGLQSLDLSSNHISKIENLPHSLQAVDLSRNQISRIENLPECLQELRLWGNSTRNIPSELLGEYSIDNCLNEVRTWFSDLEKGAELNRMIKILVSGNSNVGKSSLLEALEKGKAQPGQDSTHGIRIKPLALPDGDHQVDGIAFDFGGQEIYHGTHQLFLRSRAVQLLVFDAETETTTLSPDRRGTQGETNLNKTLPDWLNNLQRLSPGSAFVIVQNKIETPLAVPPATKSLIDQLETGLEIWTARVDTLSGRGIAALRGTLAEAAQSLPEYGMPFPSSWLAVRNYFLQNSQKLVSERERIVPKAFFEQLCAEQQVMRGSESVLLRYLHDTGVVYYDGFYLKDSIIADQQWAIEAIYEVLDRRGQLYDELANETFGKKRLKYLFAYFRDTYTDADRRLFIALMESCGLCFPLKEEHYGQVTDDTYYLFPQFLPDTRPDSVSYFLDARSDSLIYQQTVAFLPYYHVQQIIYRWGVKTDIRNIWRTGLLVRLPNEGQFVFEADLPSNTLALTAERTIPAETLSRLLLELRYQEAEWQLMSADPVTVSPGESVPKSSQPLVETVPDVVQPKIRKLVVSFAKEDVRYVNLLREKLAGRKTIDLWYDRHLTGWKDWDNQIKQHFTECDGYVIFLSNKYMDTETKMYIHEKEIPIILKRYKDGEVYVAVINLSTYNTEDTELEPFLRFKKGEVMPDPDKRAEKADSFLEEFIHERLYKDFLKGQ